MFIKNTEIFDFLKLQSQFDNIDFWNDFIRTKIGLSLNVKNLQITNQFDGCWGGLQCKQYPTELAQLMVWIYRHKNNINRYIELGVERGGTYFLIDSVLRVINPNYSDSIAVDISDKIVKKHGFIEYQNKHKSCQFIQSKTSNLTLDRQFDLCLIDADHYYNGIKSDFELMKNRCKYIVFHDIACQLPKIEVYKFWQEIKDNYKYQEFIDTIMPILLGIGIIEL